jgi:transposase
MVPGSIVVKVVYGTVKEESLPVWYAIPMAVLEQRGVCDYIDQEVRKVKKSYVNLSAGMAVKAMVGTVFGNMGYSSLYRVKSLFAYAPTDKLFGPYVKPCALSDTSIGSRYDDISLLDLKEVSWHCHELIHAGTKYDYLIIFLDGSNVTVYGEGYEGRDRLPGTMPRYGGNAKNKRNDLMQKNLVAMSDQGGHLMCSIPFDGNVSDVTMDKEAIKFLKTKIDPGSATIVADCKLATSTIIPDLFESGMGFVTKIPSRFDERIRDDVIRSAISRMDPADGHPEVEVYDTVDMYEGREIRFVAYRFEEDLGESRKYLRNKGLEDMKGRATAFKRRRFCCEADARKAFDDMMSNVDCYAYDADFEPDVDRKARGKGAACHMARITNVRIAEDRMEEAAQMHSISVLGTNVPFAAEDHDNPREGRTAYGVVDLYLRQDNAEKNFRNMKTNMGLDVIRLHNPNRQDVKGLVTSICVMLQNEMDTLLERSGMQSWTEARFHMGLCRAVYDREADAVAVSGMEDAADKVFGVMDILGVEHGKLLSR